ncbi:MAG: hypothetical protein COZ17_05745 [Flavobacteriaceae bacterium CG_4_10_14_3_um_filter_33_47]|nr:MAG: hypothetical protein COZ17_05745 [Flavobacteriaceae bacterium CG_4_10_14_3_um_filter_33_47]
MKDKKHIDRLFQEGFKDFEASPSNTVWQNIENKLTQNKKKRRVVPIWWRYAGVAALLLLLLTIGGIYFKSNLNNSVNKIVDTEEKVAKPSIEGVSSNKNTNNTKPSESHSTETTPMSTSSQNLNPSSEPVIVNSNTKENTHINTNSSSKEKTILGTNPSVNQETFNIVANQNETIKNNKISETQSIEIKKPSNNLVTKRQDTTTVAEVNLDKNNPLTSTDKTIEDAIAENFDEETESNLSKWSVATNAAPIYFNSLGKGSSLDAQFNNNSKNGDVTLSYGVSASYSVNNKLKIRTGINQVNLGYNTNNIVIFETVGLNSNSLKNIDPNNTNENIALVSGNVLSAQSSNAFVETSITSINQSLGFIEIPLEIEYAIINKKFGFNVIGGFSSFILNNNELFSEVNGNQRLIGEATNVNKVSYSANFGLGLSYKLTKKLDLNMEPLFKYQINTFNNTSGNFKPYFIGVYTGIGFKF